MEICVVRRRVAKLDQSRLARRSGIGLPHGLRALRREKVEEAAHALAVSGTDHVQHDRHFAVDTRELDEGGARIGADTRQRYRGECGVGMKHTPVTGSRRMPHQRHGSRRKRASVAAFANR